MVVPGERLADVSLAFDHNGGPAVQFRFSGSDAKAFGELTRDLVGQPLSVLVCGEEVVRPFIREPIYGGSGLITGVTEDEAALLAQRLKGEETCPAPGGS